MLCKQKLLLLPVKKLVYNYVSRHELDESAAYRQLKSPGSYRLYISGSHMK